MENKKVVYNNILSQLSEMQLLNIFEQAKSNPNQESKIVQDAFSIYHDSTNRICELPIFPNANILVRRILDVNGMFVTIFHANLSIKTPFSTFTFNDEELRLDDLFTKLGIDDAVFVYNNKLIVKSAIPTSGEVELIPIEEGFTNFEVFIDKNEKNFIFKMSNSLTIKEVKETVSSILMDNVDNLFYNDFMLDDDTILGEIPKYFQFLTFECHYNNFLEIRLDGRKYFIHVNSASITAEEIKLIIARRFLIPCRFIMLKENDRILLNHDQPLIKELPDGYFIDVVISKGEAFEINLRIGTNDFIKLDVTYSMCVKELFDIIPDSREIYVAEQELNYDIILNHFQKLSSITVHTNKIYLFIRCLNTHKSIQVYSTTSIDQLKIAVALGMNINPDIRLVYAGKQLLSGNSIRNYGLANDSTLAIASNSWSKGNKFVAIL
ncbi:hypothetical protein TRFO_08179 [Tritrichomonas foetus]|uniref:Ubiquitin-like domain-containing protein n=1 Tax=Tritrichomonas foetus TaxID=1144522 RepID=A0A1J4JRJ7_9EUKA|nr:hypothetical protein TRFO_08179 [Tritrichomonas foetus]|eukprot:OHS99876.1 hypothetical protein TRFO_08179 [Tritrichomonas foetus]